MKRSRYISGTPSTIPIHIIQTGIATAMAAGTAPTPTGACQGIDSLVPSSTSFNSKHQIDGVNICVNRR